MLFAGFFGDLLGRSCGLFILILVGLGWAVESLGKALNNDTVKEAASIGFWAWMSSMFDD